MQTSLKATTLKQAVWPVLLLGLLLILHLGLRDYVYDDAYIQIRISSHLVQYGQPYYNVGEAVNSSSSPVWTILVGAVLALSRFHLVGIAIFNAVISTLGVLTFIALLSSAVTLTVVDRIVVGAGYLAITLPSSVGWMETPLALLVMSIALLRYRRGKADSFLLFGLLPFVRLEFAALYVIALAIAIWHRKMPWQPMAAYSVAGALPLVVYELLFFGTIVPNTIIAKSTVYTLSYGLGFGMILLNLVPGSTVFSSIYGFIPVLPSLAIAAGAGSIILYLLYSKSQSSSVLFGILTAFGACVALTYILSHAPLTSWYRPIYLVPLFGALFLGTKATYPTAIRRASVLLAAPGLSLWMLALIPLLLSPLHPSLDPDFQENARTRSYLQIGQRLYKSYPQARLMTSEIGALGYGFPGYILDGAGLVTPAALQYQPLAIPEQRRGPAVGAIPTAFIAATRPELIVSMDAFIEDYIRNGDKSDYVVTQEPVYLPEDVPYAGSTLWGSSHIEVYVRRDILTSSTFP